MSQVMQAVEVTVTQELALMGDNVFRFVSAEQLVVTVKSLVGRLLEPSSERLQVTPACALGRCQTPSSVVSSAIRVATVSAAAPLTVLSEWQLCLLSRARHAVQMLFQLSERHFHPNQLRLAAVRQAKSSVELTTDEVLHLTRLEALSQLTESQLPARYMAAALFVSFSGCLGPSSQLQSEGELLAVVYASIGSAGIAIPSGAVVGDWFAVLQETPRDLYRFRTYVFNRYPSAYSAAMAVATTWEFCKTAWPVLVDKHRQVSKTWLSRFPNTLVVSYRDEVVREILRIASTSDTLLIVEDIPFANVSAQLLDFLLEAEYLLEAQSSVHPNFRLLMCTASVPIWLRNTSQVLVQCTDLNDTTAINLGHMLLSQMIHPVTYQTYAEHKLALAQSKCDGDDAFCDLLAAAVDPTTNVKALVLAARQRMEGVALRVSILKTSVQAAYSERHIYIAVSHVVYRLFLVEALTAPVSYHEFFTGVIAPAIHQHLTEGSRHFTKLKGEVVLRFSGWVNSTVASSQELVAAQQELSSVPESHNAASLCCHCVRRYVSPSVDAASTSGSLKLSRRRLVHLWTAQQRGLVPLDLLHYATSVTAVANGLGTAEVDEVALLKRFQRLLMTISSVNTLLLEDVTTQTSLENYCEWENHARAMTSERFAQLDDDAYGYMSSAICRLGSSTAPLIDPAALLASVAEIWQKWAELNHTLQVEVPKRRAVAAAILLPQFQRRCHELEAAAAVLLERICPRGIADDVNLLLAERDNVKALQKQKQDLLRFTPNRVCPAPMPTVDLLVEKCLPPQ